MILGLKVGPNDWQEKLTKDIQSSACEVYFVPGKYRKNYQQLFAFLRNKKILTGLHLSPSFDLGIPPNFATDKVEILDQSVELLKQTIRKAKDNNLTYVVYHPGGGKIACFDKKIQKFIILHQTAKKKSEEIFIETALKLENFAQKNRVSLYPETLPRMGLSAALAEYDNREIFFDPGLIGLPALEKLGKKGIKICFDICHVLANGKSQNPKVLEDFLFSWQKRLLPYIGLVHLSSYAPPFNGTDSSCSFLPEDIEKGAIPTLVNLQKFLKPFADFPEMIFIPEPQQKLWKENYLLLKSFFTS